MVKELSWYQSITKSLRQVMEPKNNKSIFIIGFGLLVVLVVIGFFIFKGNKKPIAIETPPEVVPVVEVAEKSNKVIGKSVEGRVIETYSYGTGPTHLLFVGGIHGGYEWNSVLLAYQTIDYLNKNPDVIPKNQTITIIPSLNPDGVYKIIGKEGRFNLEDVPDTKVPLGTGRFNAHNVDLNRNFDCKWQAKSTWQDKTVSAGSKVFSEPEAITFKNFVTGYNPSAVVFWHSKSNGVYSSQCASGILPRTLEIMTTYAQASGYAAIKSFDAYVTTGAAEDWLASINIPAITVELKTHETVEFNQNISGVKAILNYFKK